MATWHLAADGLHLLHCLWGLDEDYIRTNLLILLPAIDGFLQTMRMVCIGMSHDQDIRPVLTIDGLDAVESLITADNILAAVAASLGAS